MLFDNLERNKNMILGAYKKLKSFYYYDNTILYNKASLANFESDVVIMTQRIQNLAEFLCSLDGEINYQYIGELLRRVSPVPFPKSFKEQIKNDDGVLIQNTLPKNCILDKINFFIKAPVEVLILDVIWLLLVGKISYQQKSISNDSYANRLKDVQLYDAEVDLYEGIDFNSNRLFYPYFNTYKLKLRTPKTGVKPCKLCICKATNITFMHIVAMFVSTGEAVLRRIYPTVPRLPFLPKPFFPVSVLQTCIESA